MFTKKFTATIATTAAGALALTGCGSVEDSADTATDQSTSCLLYTSPSPRD